MQVGGWGVGCVETPLKLKVRQSLDESLLQCSEFKNRGNLHSFIIPFFKIYCSLARALSVGHPALMRIICPV